MTQMAQETIWVRMVDLVEIGNRKKVKMKIFTDNWFEKIKLIHNNTKMCCVVKFEYFRKLLLNLENDIVKLSKEKRDEIIKNLESTKNSITTYNELLVGELFRRLDFNIYYQPKINNKNPDWLIQKNQQSIVVEVFTKNIDDKSQKRDIIATDLRRRVKKIPIGITLSLSLGKIELKEFDSGTNKLMVTELEKWIQNKPKKGSHFEKFGKFGLIFEVDGYDERSHATLTTGFSKGVSSDRLINNYRKKYKKYADLLDIENIPYIIVGITNNFLELGIPEFLEVIFGQVFPTITFDKKGNIIEESVVQQNNGLLSKFKHHKVSAFILINNLFNKLVIEIIRNKNALYQLPDEIFPQFNWNENRIYGKMDLPLA